MIIKVKHWSFVKTLCVRRDVHVMKRIEQNQTSILPLKNKLMKNNYMEGSGSATIK